MTDLADFLLARIAEDEAAAKEAGGNVWTEQSSGVLDTGEWPDGVHALGDSRVTRFIAEHDPVRVLAECDAKKRIIDEVIALVEQYQELAEGEFKISSDQEWVPAAYLLLRLLALPY